MTADILKFTGAGGGLTSWPSGQAMNEAAAAYLAQNLSLEGIMPKMRLMLL